MKKVFYSLFLLLVSNLSIAQIPNYVPTNGLISWWGFNGNWNDDMSGNNGSNFGTTFTNDRFGNPGQACQFDNVDFVQCSNAGPGGNPVVTFSFWMKTSSTSPSQVLGYGNNATNGNDFRFIINPNCGSGAVSFDIYNSAVDYQVNANSDTWDFYTVIYDGTIAANVTAASIYKNGVLLTTSCYFQNTVGTNIFTNNPIVFGKYHGSAYNYFYTGLLDDVGIWGRALLPCEITALYEAQLQPCQLNCSIAEYPLNGNANDISGNGNNGVASDIVYITDRFGNPNSAARFNGTSSVIEGTTNGWPYGGMPRSIELWWRTSDIQTNVYYRAFQYGTNATGQFCSVMPSMLSGSPVVVFSGAYDDVNANGSWNFGEWNHTVCTFDGAMAKVYLNGALIASQAKAWSTTNTLNLFVLGALDEGSGPMQFFNGDLDDIKVYNCVLSQSEIDSIYQASSAGMNCNLTVTANITGATCFGDNDGSIDLTVSNGTSPYTYIWNNSETTEDISGLFAGNYSVTISDADGCDTTVSYSVNDGVALNLFINSNNTACGSADGTATVFAVNGTSPYSYQWTNGDSGQTADSLSAGIYMVTVTDANGCSESENFGINNFGTLSVNAMVTDASCSGVFDGAINLIVVGGNSPYTYSWSNGATSEDLANIKSGSYMVQVTDANGCVAVYVANVGTNSVDLSNVSIVSPTCGNADGEITVTPSGGITPYTYSWSANAGGSTTGTASNLAAGTYTIMVSDNSGCEAILPISISNSGGPNVVVNSIVPASCGNLSGEININVSGGTSPYSYSWSNGETTQDNIGLIQGNYSVDVSGGNGCVTSINVDVPSASLPPITLCVSTVDSTNGKVLCVWTKPIGGTISHFNIYRENAIAGQYDYWFSRPYDSTSQWTDQSANPQIRGWRYKVTYVDTCGNESPFGINHKTIHLISSPSVSGGVNVAWDTYEGFNYPTFYIERYHVSTGWVTIDSIPSSLHSYYDTTSLTGLLLYAVNIDSPNFCDPTRTGINTSRSNVKNQPVSGGNGLTKENNRIEINLFPNPANDEINIHIENYNGIGFTINFYNAIGELVFQKNCNASKQKIDTRNLAPGIYTFQFISENGNSIEKVVINK